VCGRDLFDKDVVAREVRRGSLHERDFWQTDIQGGDISREMNNEEMFVVNWLGEACSGKRFSGGGY